MRRERIDPQFATSAVRRLAEDVVGEHYDRSLTGAVAPTADPGAMVGELVARTSGFGALQQLLDDREIEEIWINGPSRVYVAWGGRPGDMKRAHTGVSPLPILPTVLNGRVCCTDGTPSSAPILEGAEVSIANGGSTPFVAASSQDLP